MLSAIYLKKMVAKGIAHWLDRTTDLVMPKGRLRLAGGTSDALYH